MNIHIFDNKKKLYHKASQELIDLVCEKPNAILGLATGTSPLDIYREMIKDHEKNHTSYKEVTFFNLDEYVGISKDDNQSYSHFMNENLFKYLDINQENTHIPNGNALDIKKECELYDQMLNQHIIDLQILGIGSNGHIGFNEPGTSFDISTHVIKLNETTRIDNARFFESIDQVPHQAITMGIKNIMNAKKIILIATGKSKASAVRKMIRDEVHTDCPASILQRHPDVHIFLDIDSASKL